MANSFIRDRYHRLRNLKAAQRGNVWMATCRCRHLAAPIKKYGELLRIDAAMAQVKCSGCGQSGEAEAELFRLCEPGCGRHRG